MASDPRKPSYEPADVPHPWIIAGGVAGMIAFTLVLMGALLLVYLPAAPKAIAPERFADPQLEPVAHQEYDKVIAAQRKKLKQSGWVDESAGIAAIPVEQAMRIIAGRGGAAFDPLPETAPAAPEKEDTP